MIKMLYLFGEEHNNLLWKGHFLDLPDEYYSRGGSLVIKDGFGGTYTITDVEQMMIIKPLQAEDPASEPFDFVEEKKWYE